MLLDARESHGEVAGEIADGRVAAPETFEDAASGGIREGREGAVQPGRRVNHVVQYKGGLRRCKGFLR